jgi:hypothetical protein
MAQWFATNSPLHNSAEDDGAWRNVDAIDVGIHQVLKSIRNGDWSYYHN